MTETTPAPTADVAPAVGARTAPLTGVALGPFAEDGFPEGWLPGDRAYPYWDERIESTVVKHTADGEWMVSVSSLLFNNRILLSHVSGYPCEWVSGFCYDKGPAAAIAATAWEPETEPRPVGYKKVANDARFPHLPD